MPSLSFGLLAAPLLSGLFSTAAGMPSGRPVSARAAFTRSGCFTDTDAASRALPADFKGDDTMTVEMCAEYCSAYQLFGLEYGRECYCGNERGTSSVAAPDAECSFPCPGDAAETCGAGSRVEIYTNDAYTPPTMPAAPTGAQYLGCFVDAAERVFPDRIISEDDMTAAKCAANCEGYTYFGTQWGRECYCGNTAPTEVAPASECNMACSGDATEVCGAGMRLSVYGPVIITTTPPVVETTNPAAVGDFVYDGCYTDSIALRVLGGDTISSPDMTLASCSTICAGYTYFGVEYGIQCFCGTELDPSGVKSPETDCAMKCPGDDSLICGDASRLTVYKKETAPAAASNPATVGDFKYQSCWTDAVGGRSLADTVEASSDMTVEMCAAFCDGYAFFGVEYATECYCGNELAGESSAEQDCGQLCAGNPSQWCGGASRMNLYAINPISSPSSSAIPETTASPGVPSTTFTSTSTVADETSTITPAAQLTTVTSCPPSSTVVAGQSSCYGTLPAPCAALSSTALSGVMAYMSVQMCTMSLGYPLPTPIASCFPSDFGFNNQAAPVYSCMQSAGFICSYASDCATSTYTVGQEPTSAPVPTNPVVQNPGFESGTKDGWSFTDRANPFTDDVSSVRTHSGNSAFRVYFANNGGGNTLMKQNVQVTPGGNYTLSVWVSNDNPTGSACGMSLQATPIPAYISGEMSFKDVPAGTWKKISTNFQAVATWVTISADYYCNGAGGGQGAEIGKNTLYLDDFEVTSRDV